MYVYITERKGKHYSWMKEVNRCNQFLISTVYKLKSSSIFSVGCLCLKLKLKAETESKYLHSIL